MESPLYFDDIVLGRTWISPRRTVTEADVIQFATSTGDFNPLHVDYDFASKSHYRQPVAHGLLGLSWVAGLGSYFPSVNTLAFTAVRNWEFCRPLFFGDTVFVETTCQEKFPSGRKSGKVIWARRLINQKDQVVQQGVFETLVAVKSGVESARVKSPHHKPGVQPSDSIELANDPGDRMPPASDNGSSSNRGTLI